MCASDTTVTNGFDVCGGMSSRTHSASFLSHFVENEKPPVYRSATRPLHNQSTLDYLESLIVMKESE